MEGKRELRISEFLVSGLEQPGRLTERGFSSKEGLGMKCLWGHCRGQEDGAQVTKVLKVIGLKTAGAQEGLSSVPDSSFL